MTFELLIGAFLALILLAVIMTAKAVQHDQAVLAMPLAVEHHRLELEIASRRQELADLTARIRERDEALRKRDDLAAECSFLDGRREELRAEVETLKRERAGFDDFVRELQAKIEEAAQADAQLREARRGLEETLREIEEKERRAAALEERIAALNSAVEEARQAAEQAVAELERLRHEGAESRARLAGIMETFEQRAAEVQRLEGRKKALEADIELLAKLRDGFEMGGSGGAGPGKDEPLGNLRDMPPCLVAAATAGDRTKVPEHEALGEVERYLRDLGLNVPAERLFAFHTALKIAEASPMTVLAGISGTGKSLLPRRYAEAMGISFLQVAVQPRWDNPDDLLGFYNYIEKGYRATELAQAMIRFDPWNWPDEAKDGPWRDRLLLVLLDEMNLARVEYYFSDFLSRLEVRPRFAQVGDASQRRGAEITLPLPAAAGAAARRLFPAHNVLFAGTMNEDESTQALSDKVLDRANLLQFPRPRDFRTGDAKAPAPPVGALSLATWRGWIRTPEQMERGERETADRVIGALSEAMAAFDRPFGHRLRNAVLAYAANYPSRDGRDGGERVRTALAQQIDSRILPRLRGVEVEAHRQHFDAIARIVDENGLDRSLSEAIRKRTGQAASGLFVWRGREDSA